MKLKEEQEILQCSPELVAGIFFYPCHISVKKRLASEKTNFGHRCTILGSFPWGLPPLPHCSIATISAREVHAYAAAE